MSPPEPLLSAAELIAQWRMRPVEVSQTPYSLSDFGFRYRPHSQTVP